MYHLIIITIVLVKKYFDNIFLTFILLVKI